MLYKCVEVLYNMCVGILELGSKILVVVCYCSVYCVYLCVVVLCGGPVSPCTESGQEPGQ